MRKQFDIAAALLLAFVVASCDRGQPAPADSTVVRAPDYSARTLSGDSISLASLSGKVVLVNIWATWCIPCRQEIPALQQIHQAHQADGFTVVGISVDAHGAEDRVAAFMKEYNVSYPVWLDPDERATFVFRAVGVPASYLIDRTGNIVWKHLGPVDDVMEELERTVRRTVAKSAN